VHDISLTGVVALAAARSVRAITLADVVAAANRWLTDENAQEARVVPGKPEAIAGP
jgi:predicted Zn-dependent peptidase